MSDARRWLGALLCLLVAVRVGPLSAQAPRGAIITSEAGDSLEIGGERVPTLIKVDPITTGSQRFFVFQRVLDPGDSLPRHRHHRDDELIFVHSGEVTALAAEKEALAPAGATIYVPAGQPMRVVNSGREPATLLIIFAASHMAEYIRSLGSAPGEPPRNLSPTELNDIRRRHHITFP